MSALGRSVYQLAFQVSPIILTGGIAANIPGGMLPIISITQAVDFALGLLQGNENLDLDDFFAAFEPLPGATLIDQAIGTYPFANQATAANAVITKPLAISLLMHVPVREPLGYPAKLATMMALKAALEEHNATGGTYTVATPVFFFTNCLMLRMVDVTAGETKQRQVDWQIDFAAPLLSEAQAIQAQNSLMSKISNGTQIVGQPSYSGLAPTVGVPPSLATLDVVPAASGAPAAGVAGPSPLPVPGP